MIKDIPSDLIIRAPMVIPITSKIEGENTLIFNMHV